MTKGETYSEGGETPKKWHELGKGERFSAEMAEKYRAKALAERLRGPESFVERPRTPEQAAAERGRSMERARSVIESGRKFERSFEAGERGEVARAGDYERLRGAASSAEHGDVRVELGRSGRGAESMRMHGPEGMRISADTQHSSGSGERYVRHAVGDLKNWRKLDRSAELNADGEQRFAGYEHSKDMQNLASARTEYLVNELTYEKVLDYAEQAIDFYKDKTQQNADFFDAQLAKTRPETEGYAAIENMREVHSLIVRDFPELSIVELDDTDEEIPFTAQSASGLKVKFNYDDLRATGEMASDKSFLDVRIEVMIGLKPGTLAKNPDVKLAFALAHEFGHDFDFEQHYLFPAEAEIEKKLKSGEDLALYRMASPHVALEASVLTGDDCRHDSGASESVDVAVIEHRIRSIFGRVRITKENMNALYDRYRHSKYRDDPSERAADAFAVAFCRRHLDLFFEQPEDWIAMGDSDELLVEPGLEDLYGMGGGTPFVCQYFPAGQSKPETTASGFFYTTPTIGRPIYMNLNSNGDRFDKLVHSDAKFLRARFAIEPVEGDWTMDVLKDIATRKMCERLVVAMSDGSTYIYYPLMKDSHAKDLDCSVADLRSKGDIELLPGKLYSVACVRDNEMTSEARAEANGGSDEAYRKGLSFRKLKLGSDARLYLKNDDNEAFSPAKRLFRRWNSFFVEDEFGRRYQIC